MSLLELLWLLPLCAVVSVVYSASRSDDWNVILTQSLRRFVQFVLATIVLGLALVLISKVVQTL